MSRLVPKQKSLAFVLYDPDGQRREAFHSALSARSVNAEVCYSLDKLKLIVERSQAKRCVLLHPKSETDSIISVVLGPNWTTLFYDADKIFSVPSIKEEDFSTWFEQVKILKKSATFVEELKKGKTSFDLILIGSSTGGIPVVHEVIDQLVLSKTRVILCQHISEEMTGELTNGILRRVRCPVSVVQHQTPLNPGTLYVLTGKRDFRLAGTKSDLCLIPAIEDASLYHPSFDLLTKSLLELVQRESISSVCVFLSGLGNDGAKHLTDLKAAGVEIVVQDPATAVAASMPASAIKTGAVSLIFSSEKIREYIRRTAA